MYFERVLVSLVSSYHRAPTYVMILTSSKGGPRNLSIRVDPDQDFAESQVRIAHPESSY